MTNYRPETPVLTLGEDFYDQVTPAQFPLCVPRFLNERWAERIGLDLDDEAGAHFCRFEPLPDNLIEPLALRYHGHQFRVYNPDIGDGRGFSIARLLRERHGYKGELRAVGQITRDHLFFLESVGFNAFELREGESAEEAIAAFGDFSESYQASPARPVPLFRRR